MTYQVRGPDPDGEWFVLEDGTAIDEVFASEADAAKKCAELNGEGEK